jgi:hypothetical protein
MAATKLPEQKCNEQIRESCERFAMSENAVTLFPVVLAAKPRWDPLSYVSGLQRKEMPPQ